MAPPDSQTSLTSISTNVSINNMGNGMDSACLDFDTFFVPAVCYSYTINHADGTSNFPFVSEYCETTFGFTADHLMKHPELLMNAVHKDDSEKFTKSVVESMQNMTVWDFQFRMLDKDGNVKFVHGKSKPTVVSHKGTTLTKWNGVLFDITEQEKHNQAHRDEMRALMNESMAPIFGVDCSGVIYKWNDMMGQLTGYTKAEVTGKPLINFMKEEDHGCVAMLLSSKKMVEEVEQECCLQTKDDKAIYLYVKCVTRHDSNGDVTGVAFVGQDITKVKEEEKKKEAALKLVDAEKGLTEWLSHEVRNPLSVATEAAEALKDDALNEESASHVELISQSLSYIVDLLTDMLDLNKCIEGKVMLHSKECDIRKEVLIPTRDMMNMRTKAVQVSVEGDEGVMALVDSLRLRQVITNLVSNSLKFTTVGFVRIHLQQANDVLILRVSDSGCGISQEHYDSLFSKWEQLGSRTNGTGIGLCLCQALVRVMGGHIFLNREYLSGIEGHPGAEFVIELPIHFSLNTEARKKTLQLSTFDAVSRAVVAARSGNKASSTVHAESTEESARISDGTSTSGDITLNKNTCVSGRYHILIVDDDRVGRKFIRRRFQRLFPDAEIEEAVSGEEAIAKARERDVAYDIITMDHFMGIGDMNGAETIQALRDDKVDALIIGISGNAKQGEHMSAGAENFMQKPIPSDEAILGMLLMHLAPPTGWSVLTVDDVKMNNRFLARKLQKISSPHFTDMSVAEKRWNITSASSGEEAIALLQSRSFDLVVLDHQLGDGISGMEVGKFVRENALNEDAIIVLCSGSLTSHGEAIDNGEGPFNLFWTKPLPNANKMRLNLCCKLLSRQRPDLLRHQSSSINSNNE